MAIMSDSDQPPPPKAGEVEAKNSPDNLLDPHPTQEPITSDPDPPSSDQQLHPIWPRRVSPHPAYDLLPLHHIWFTHSKDPYDSSGVNCRLCGATTLLTQGAKTIKSWAPWVGFWFIST